MIKRGKKKAQAAMEFLMTYGWAILVVLIAIGALAYFGVLSPEKLLPEKCVIPTGSGLFCADFAAEAGVGIKLKLKNMLSEKVDIAVGGINVTYDTNTCTNAAAVTIDPDGTSGIITIGEGCTVAKGKIKGDITIKFTPEGGIPKSTIGTLVTTAA